MITLQDLFHYLDSYLDVANFTDYGPNGVQIEGKEQIKKIAFAVSASEEVISKAKDVGVDALIVHHGLFWKFDPDLTIVSTKRKKIATLLEGDISCMGYHLPLDAHQEVGNNWKAARDMGWTALKPFGEQEIGVYGSFSPMSRDAFQKSLEEYYQHLAHTALGGKETVSNAVLISGGAHGSIKDAIKLGADCFITGSFDEWVWREAMEYRINFFALGHHATERIGVKALMEHLVEKFSIQGEWIDDHNPF